MIEFMVDGEKSHLIVKAYNWWDLPKNKRIITNIHDARKKDIGHFLKLNDGSLLYVKIISWTHKHIHTSIGAMRVNDIINVARPKPVHYQYSGVRRGYESFLVTPPTLKEMHEAKEIIKAGLVSKKIITYPRVRILIMNKLKEALETITDRKGNPITPQWLVQRVVDHAESNNQHSFKALTALGHIMGMELLPTPTNRIPQKDTPFISNTFNMQQIDRSAQISKQIESKTLAEKGVIDANYEVIPPDNHAVPSLKKIKKMVESLPNDIFENKKIK